MNTFFVQTATKSTANTTGPTSIIGTGIGTNIVSGNTMFIGQTFRSKITGYFDIAANPSLTITVKLGTVTLFTTTNNMNGAIDNIFNIEFIFTVINTGTSGVIRGEGDVRFGSNKHFVLAMIPNVIIDTTINNLLDVITIWSAASPSNYTITTNIYSEKD